MMARDLVSSIIPPLKTSDTGEKALRWMGEFRISHLPIVNNEQLLGLISEEDILDLSTPSEPLGNHELSISKASVDEQVHIYEVIKTIYSQKLTALPVVDEKKNYVGLITLDSLVEHFARINSLDSPGGILVLEMNLNDYSLAEIARLVEANDAKILSSYITSYANSTKIEVTIKVNTTELRQIEATFERFEYTVKGYYNGPDREDGLRDRYDSFMRYLNT